MFEAIGNIELKSIGLSSDAAANAQNLINRADSGEFKGEKGDKSYLHVAYADSSDGVTGFSLVDSINKLYIGQYADYISSPSEDPTMYRWTLIKGDKGNTGAKGDTGISVVDMVDEWYLSSSSSDKKGGSWSTIRSEWKSGRYFWRRIKTSYSDGSTSYSPSEDGYFDSVITNSVADSAHAKETANTANTTASNANNTANTAKNIANEANKVANESKKDLTNYILSNTEVISQMQTQIDGSIMTWFYPYPPSNDKVPTSEWTTADIRNQHLGDLYYDTDTGYCYRYQVEHQTHSWQRITDVDVTKALSDAKNAQDTADNKRRVFVVKPIPPYDIGDLWVEGSSGDIKKCRSSKTASQSYSDSDWELASKYTDDEKAKQVENDLTEALNNTEANLNEQITSVSNSASQTAQNLHNAVNNLSGGISEASSAARNAEALANMASKDLQNYKNLTVDPQLKMMSDFMQNYNMSFRQDSSGFYITNQNPDGSPSTISLRLGNDRISFIQGTGETAFEVAYISNNKLYITSGEFLDELRIGNYAFIPGIDGDLNFKKVK